MFKVLESSRVFHGDCGRAFGYIHPEAEPRGCLDGFALPYSQSWYLEGMVDPSLQETLESLSPAEQKAILAVAEYLKRRRTGGQHPQQETEALIQELSIGEPIFATPDGGLPPARRAARRFMR